jgi:hypothetical protein
VTRLEGDELLDLCESQGIDPDLVVGVDVSDVDVVVVLRIPLERAGPFF